MSNQTASELLIKIKTILESQGIDAAKKEMDEIIARQGQNAAAQKMAKELLEQNGKATREVADETGKAAQELNKASRAAWAMRMAAQGSTEGLRGLSNAAAASGAVLGGLVARVTMVGAAFMAGWKVGGMIREHLIDPLIEVADDTEKARQKAVAAAQQYRALSTISLAALVKELKDAEVTTEKVIGSIERVYQQQRQLEAARGNKEVARIMEIMPAGPDRDLAITKAQVEQKQRDLDLSTASAKKELQYANKERSDAAAGVQELERRKAEATAKREAAASISVEFGRFDPEESRALREYMEDVDKKLSEARERQKEVEEKTRDKILAAQNTIDINTEEARKAQSELRQAYDKRGQAAFAERKVSTRDTLTAEFGITSDPARLKEISDALTAIDLNDVKETDPQAKLMRQRLVLSQGRERLQDRLQAVAVTRAEGDVASARTPQALSRAESNLKAAKEDNQSVINRILGISESFIGDQQGIKQRLSQLESQMKAFYGQMP